MSSVMHEWCLISLSTAVERAMGRKQAPVQQDTLVLQQYN